jgi:VWFA-related protein
MQPWQRNRDPWNRLMPPGPQIAQADSSNRYGHLTDKQNRHPRASRQIQKESLDMRPLTCLTAAIAILLTIPTLSRAQDEPQSEFAGQIDVTEVLLDVLVTDPSGNVIVGLQPEDFIVKDGGEEVEVTSATFYSNRRFVESAKVAERLGVQPDEVPSDRFFILFFHDQRFEDPSITSNVLDALRWAKLWVEEETLAYDYVAVLSYDVKLKVHQDFTLDRQALVDALDSVAKMRNPENTWPSRTAEHEGPSLRQNLPQGKELSRQTRRIYSGLELTAEAAGYIMGRKNMLLFSFGFGDQNDFGTYYPDPRYYPPMMQALNDNNVAVYSISWFKNLGDQSSSGQDQIENVLSQLSADTDGTFYFNFVNFQTPLIKVVDDNNGYYLLSYSAEHERGRQGYQQVEVTTRNPEFRVRGRNGYLYGESE